MRIFEKISRRLAITLAGVMACSSFAMAPAITASAAAGQTVEKVVLEELAKEATALTNEADYAEEVTLTHNDTNNKTYKIHSDLDGKLTFTILAKEAAKLNVITWKAGDEKVITPADDSIDKDKACDKTIDVKEGDYYIDILNVDTEKDTKIQVKAYIRPADIKTSKIRNAESPAKKTAKVTIKKAKKVDGYEVRFSTSKDFDKNVKTKSVKAKKIEFKDKKGTIEKSGLKSGKKYYVQVRTYVKENGVKYYSDWSKSKKIAKVK